MDARYTTRPRRTGAISCAGSLSGMRIQAPFGDRDGEILTPEALGFLRTLVLEFAGPIRSALSRRAARRHGTAAGTPNDFSPETRTVREAEWTVRDLPPLLRSRVVELTGPPEPGALTAGGRAGADAYVADFEDGMSPVWGNLLEGQLALRDAYRERAPAPRASGPLLFVRPRGLHLVEAHVRVDDRPVPAGLFDFALFFFHNAIGLARRGEGPFFHLPKLEDHREARIWSRIFSRGEQLAGLPEGTVRARAQIETVPAAFEMDEILWELRHHSAGLGCGYPDYLFSFVKSRREDPAALLPDAASVLPYAGGEEPPQPFLLGFTRLLVRTAHRRGAPAIGGTLRAAGPGRDLAPLRAAVRWEAETGFDGTRVADPRLVPTVRAVFEGVTGGGDQLHVMPEGVVSASDLLRPPSGPRTEAGLRNELRSGIRALAAWLSGLGSLAPRGVDLSLVELARTLAWQWVRHRATLDDGREVTEEVVRRLVAEESDHLSREATDDADTTRVADARLLFERLCCSDALEEFVSLPAYRLLEDGV